MGTVAYFHDRTIQGVFLIWRPWTVGMGSRASSAVVGRDGWLRASYLNSTPFILREVSVHRLFHNEGMSLVVFTSMAKTFVAISFFMFFFFHSIIGSGRATLGITYVSAVWGSISSLVYSPGSLPLLSLHFHQRHNCLSPLTSEGQMASHSPLDVALE